MLAKKLGESEISKTVQLAIEMDVTSTANENLILTQLGRLQYFRNQFRKLQIQYFFEIKNKNIL